MLAGSVANGPSITVTDSPTSKSTSMTGLGAISVAVEAAAAASAAGFFCCCAAGTRNFTTSSMESGDGREVAPTKPVTPGVLRTAPHDSSLSSIRTRM